MSLLGIMLSRQNAFNVFITFFFKIFNNNLFSYLLYTLYVLVYYEGFDYKTTTRKQRHKTIGLSYKPRIMHMKRLHSTSYNKSLNSKYAIGKTKLVTVFDNIVISKVTSHFF